MKILWIPGRCPVPIDTGGKYSLFNRIKYMNQRHEIYLVVPGGKLTKEDEKTLSKVCRKISIVEEKHISTLEYIKCLMSNRSINVERRKNADVTEKVKEYLLNYDFDIICLDVPMTEVVLEPIIELIGDLPIILNQHNIEFLCIKSKKDIAGVNPIMKLYALVESSRLYRWEQKLYSSGIISGQIFVTKEDLKLFKDSFPINSNIKYLYCPPIVNLDSRSEDYKKPYEMENGKNIVFIAAFDYFPNIHGAVWFVKEVFPLVKKGNKLARLLLVGKNPSDKVKKLAREDVIVTGTVHAVEPYIKHADVIITPIFFGGGIKIKLIQAGAYGKPVVSTSFGAYGSVYENKKDILIADDPKLFAKFCLNILENPEEYRDMSRNFLRTTRENYSYESAGKRFEEMIIEVLK